MEVSNNLVRMFVGFPSYTNMHQNIVNLKHVHMPKFDDIHDPNHFGNIG